MAEKSYWLEELVLVQDESFSEELRKVLSNSGSMVQAFLIKLNMTPSSPLQSALCAIDRVWNM